MLESPRAEARVDGTSSRITTNSSLDTYQVAGTLTAAGTAATIKETGLFDAITAGSLYLRGTFDVVNLNVGDSIAFTIKSVFDQSA